MIGAFEIKKQGTALSEAAPGAMVAIVKARTAGADPIIPAGSRPWGAPGNLITRHLARASLDMICHGHEGRRGDKAELFAGRAMVKSCGWCRRREVAEVEDLAVKLRRV